LKPLKVIAIIPARGGSKRIPDKNIIDFFNKPLIAYTIEAAKKVNIFQRIFISTDSQKIANISKDFGLDIPFLRDKNFDDDFSVHEATLTAINQVENYWNEKYDIVVQLMPNCPIRNENQIKESFNNFIAENNTFQISIFKFGWMNPWWAIKIINKDKPERLFPDAFKMRSQDLDDLYCPSGAIWIAKIDKLKEHRTFYGPGFRTYPINWKYAVDIDDYEDLEMAKCVYLLINNDQKNE